MDLTWIKSHKWVVAVFGAATAGAVLYSYLNRGKGASSSTTATAGSPQYLVPVVQMGTDPNPTVTTPSSNVPVSTTPTVLPTQAGGAGATVQLGSVPGFTAPVPTSTAGLSLAQGSLPAGNAPAVTTSPGTGYNVQTGATQAYSLTGGGTTAGGLALGPADAYGYNSGNTGGTPYVYEGGMLVTRDASGF